MEDSPRPNETITVQQTTQSIQISRDLGKQSSQSPLTPWEKLPDESQLWFERFLLYRGLILQDRTVTQAYHLYLVVISQSRSKSPPKAGNIIPKLKGGVQSDWYDAADRYNWAQRADLYHQHLERLARETKENEIRKIAQQEVQEEYQRQRQSAKILVTAGLVSAQRISKRLATDEKFHLKPSETANFIRIGTSIQHEVEDRTNPTPTNKSLHGSNPGVIVDNSVVSAQDMANFLAMIPDGRPQQVIDMEKALKEKNVVEVKPAEEEYVDYSKA